MPDLQTQLRQYGQELDHQYPDVGFDELLERVSRTRPRPSATKRGVAIGLAAAIAVVVVIGGVALLHLFGGTEAPVVTAPPQPSTTAAAETTLPSGIDTPESGLVESVDTSHGRWTWRQYGGSLSELGDVTPAPSRLPADAAIPADTPAPAIDGVDWAPIEAMTATRDGVTVTAVANFGMVDWSALVENSALPYWDQSALRLDLNLGSGDTKALTIDVVRGTLDVVEFRFSDTGELLLRLEATDPIVVAEQLTGEAAMGPYWGPVVWSLRVGNGEASWIEPPWRGLAVDFVKVVSTPDDLILVAVGRPAWEEPNRFSILWSWRSEDGRSWEPLGEPLPIHDIATGLELAAKGDQLVALLTGDGANLVGLVDGSHWEVVQADIAGVYFTEGFGPVSWGWVLAGYRQDQESTTWVERCEVWISADGISWERIGFAPDISAIDGATTTACYVAGDGVLALRDFASSGVRWIGALED